jgi:formylglycine-generating enzyme required for sulfatase activity
MRIFISYARIDKPYCIQIVNTLDGQEVWYDQRLYAGQHWWKEIMRRLDWCEVFVYLLSPESVTSEYCLKELDIAIKLGREIIPVLIHSDTKIPTHLADMQYIDVSRGLNIENVKMLLDSIFKAHENLQEKRWNSTLRRANITAELPVSESANIVGQAAAAMKAGQYDRALYLLKRAKASGHVPKYINIDSMIIEAEKSVEVQALRREAMREYQVLVDLFMYPGWRKHAMQGFVEFQKRFPKYDPQNLARYLPLLQSKPERAGQGQTQVKIQSIQSSAGASTQSEEESSHIIIPEKSFLPMLEWVSIPEGGIRVENVISRNHRENRTFVEKFMIARYPITNAQFDVFLRDPRGYQHERWWRFSKQALDWHSKHPDPLESKFLGEDRPRETVNWYEAMAFCDWLSHRMKVKIALPTLAQWIRAAVGDKNLLFPWGDTFNQIYCNTRENGLKQTTPVTRYKDGISAYGVYDMAGNVWEWCLDKTEPESREQDYKRGVVGGSYVSPCERAQTSERLFLNPETRYSSIGFRVVALADDAQHNEARK